MQARLDAFEKVYRRELPFVWAAARRLGVPPAVIDDAVQDVFVTAYRRRADLHTDVSPRAWLYGVTRRVAFRYRRSHARTMRRKAAVARGVEGSVATQYREREEAHDVDAVLAVLEPNRREVFVMAELLEMTAPEIAAQLEIPVNTVYSRLRLARRELEPRLRRGVDAWASRERARDRPAAEQAQRTWAVLVPLLGRMSTGGSAVGSGSPSGGWTLGGWTFGRALGMVAAVGLVAVAVVTAPKRPRAREANAVPTVAEARVGPTLGAVAGEPSAARPEPMSATATDERPPVEAVEPRIDQRSRPSSARPERRTEVEAPDGVPGLAEEVALLDRAATALRAGDAAHALQWLADHERRFSAGHLVDVRKAHRVRALCRLGRDAQARAEAAALRREHPSSAVAQRTPLACEES